MSGYRTSAASVALAVASLMDGTQWELVSRVMLTVAWPRSSCTSFGSTPRASKSAAVVCHRV
jgi:hypothetical protein